MAILLGLICIVSIINVINVIKVRREKESLQIEYDILKVQNECLLEENKKIYQELQLSNTIEDAEIKIAKKRGRKKKGEK